VKRNFILVAKVIQALSNGVQFGDKEKWMMPINSYLEKQNTKLRSFFHEITDVSIPTLVLEEKKTETATETDETIDPESGGFAEITVRELHFLYEIANKHISTLVSEKTDPLYRVVVALPDLQT